MAITRNDGTPIQLVDTACDTLYRSLEFKMGGLSVSRNGQIVDLTSYPYKHDQKHVEEQQQ
jgi:hypothetical protein